MLRNKKIENPKNFKPIRMNNRSKLMILVSGLLLFLGGALFYQAVLKQKTAYVNLQEVFDEFKGKKELAVSLQRFENRSRSLLDSLSMDIQVLQRNLPRQKEPQAVLAKLEEKQNLFQKINYEYTNQYQEQEKQFTDQIWMQINQYVNDYGTAAGYDYVFGINGNGTLMYAAERKNITSEIINYINDRYEGL